MNKKLFITVNITVKDPAYDKEIWMKLQEDVYDAGLIAEFSDFFLENPDMSILEIDREFRDEWDI